MEELSLVQRLAVLALPLIFAITVHEAAHGYAAWRLGDDTAHRLGRITLNPIAHFDPIGSLVVPILSALLIGVPFGWAKPVPVRFDRLRSPRVDSALVALAGPGSNLLMALLWSMVMLAGQHLLHTWQALAYPLMLMGGAGVFVNLVLMLLNMMPVPPLDGGRVLVGILPKPAARLLARVEPFGLLILVALLATGLLGSLLGPAIYTALGLMPGGPLVPVILQILFP